MQQSRMETEEDDAYDLQAVEVRLAQLAERRKRLMQQRQKTNDHQQNQIDSTCSNDNKSPKIVADFDLERVESDIDGDSDDTNSLPSDPEDHNADKKRTRRNRLKDSLDLSMSASVIWPPASSAKQPKPTKLAGSKQIVTQTAKSPALHLSEEQPVISQPPMPNQSVNNNGNQSTNSNGDLFTGKLVQRRRQLEREAALEVTAASQTNVQPASKPLNQHDTNTSGIPQPRTQLPKQMSNIERARLHPPETRIEPERPETTTTTTDNIKPAHQPMIKEKPAYPVPPPAFVNNARKILNQEPEMLVPTFIPAAVQPPVVKRSIPKQKTPSEARYSSNPTTTKQPNAVIRKAPEPVAPRTHALQLDEDDDEEARLRQSLEKLNSRLTKLSSSPTASCKSSASSSTYSAASVCSQSSTVLPQRPEVDDDDQTLRLAPYGGGTHCKLHQKASPALRSSHIKRAELSSGIPKARVRAPAAAAMMTPHEPSSSAGHKVVVKKDLAHLLF